MGIMSSRAGTVTVRVLPSCVLVCGITDVRPNLPPQQPADHRVQICDEIRLACVRGRGPGFRASNKKATVRQRLKVPAHKRGEPPLDAVPGHCRADGPAYHESY